MPKVTFIEANGNRVEIDAPVGKSLMEIARDNGVDIEGACEGAMACSTCHIIVEAEWCDRLPPPSEDEQDMLDLAWGLTKRSRLGCQIEMTEGLDGLTVALPKEVRNMLF